MDPVQKKWKIKQSYDEQSYLEIYDRRYQIIQFQKTAELFALFTNNMCSTDVMLDFGAGTGLLWDYFHQQNLPPLKKEGFPNRLIGIDLSWGMLSKFLQKLKTTPTLPQFVTSLICCDGEALPLRDRQFTHLMALTSLQNLPDVSRGLQEISRVLTKKGVFGLTYLRKSLSKSALETQLRENFPQAHVSFPDLEKSSPDIEDWIYLVET